ncbi:MAG: pimeloyl-ACP methyl ester carboxylesterase [Phycisphaerales bacterium]
MPSWELTSWELTSWELTNDLGLTLLGNSHTPARATAACAILAHGFLGYKDYGFIPLLADRLAAAGVLVHRFNFACSGMTSQTETFARPDLFALDTWSRQVEDVRRVARAVREGELPGAGLPLHLIGHSRGGDTVILGAGRHEAELNPAGVVTINAPADADRLSEEARTQMLADGFLEVRSGRTGQTLRLGRAWLDEQRADPDAHNLELQAAQIRCPVLVLQGDSDDTVPIRDAERLAAAANTAPVILKGGTHVLNISNPADDAARAHPGPVFDHACREILARVLAPDA